MKKLSKTTNLLCLIAGFLIAFCISWDYTYITTTPAGTDDPREADDRMREIKAADQERSNVDHYWTASAADTYDAADTGKHRQIQFRAPLSANPASVDADEAQLYTKDVSSKAELHWIDEDENALQLTSAGTINITSADLVGTLANATYFTAVDAAGTGTVDLIKADANDVAVVPDNSQTATNAAPTSSTGIANKKYVDDYVDTQVSVATSPTSDSTGTLTPATWTSLTLTDVTAKSIVVLRVSTTVATYVGVRAKGDTSTLAETLNANQGGANIGRAEPGADTTPLLITTTDSSGNIDVIVDVASVITCTPIAIILV